MLKDRSACTIAFSVLVNSLGSSAFPESVTDSEQAISNNKVSNGSFESFIIIFFDAHLTIFSDLCRNYSRHICFEAPEHKALQ
jgi:hypothetical protein